MINKKETKSQNVGDRGLGDGKCDYSTASLLPVFCRNFMASSVNMRQQCCSAGIRAPTSTLESLATDLYMPFQIPFCTIGVTTFITFVLLLSMHFHKVLEYTMRSEH